MSPLAMITWGIFGLAVGESLEVRIERLREASFEFRVTKDEHQKANPRVLECWVLETDLFAPQEELLQLQTGFP